MNNKIQEVCMEKKTLISIFRLIPSLVRLIEAIVPGKGQGVVKKTAVKESVKAIVDGVHAVSTGGQKETWDLIHEPVDQTIDIVADSLFGHGLGYSEPAE